MPQRTPLYDAHVRLGGKMADFAGWALPLWYPAGQTAEHLATRKACGLFDICHMGELRIRGAEAPAFLSSMLTNRVAEQQDGQAMYHFLLNPEGGVIDDCILYRFTARDFMLVVNASNTETDLRWLSDSARGRVSIEDLSAGTAKLDLQGPAAPRVLAGLMPRERLETLRFFRFLPSVDIGGMDVLVSRTGYTGEVGFELYTAAENAGRLWDLLLARGAGEGCLPCGLGARDSLRLEAGLPLHGHELGPDRIALGHPWDFAVRPEGGFTGHEALAAAGARGGFRHVAGFVMKGRRKAMPGWRVRLGGDEVGTVLSAVIAPSLGQAPIGFLESDRDLAPGQNLEFAAPSGDVTLPGAAAQVPFVPPTSRRKMESFL